MKHVRFFDEGATPVSLELPDGVTISGMLAQLGVKPQPQRQLSQNGRPAKPSDPVQDKAVVMRMARGLHG